MSAMGTLQVATYCFITALNWSSGKLTVVCAWLASEPCAITPIKWSRSVWEGGRIGPKWPFLLVKLRQIDQVQHSC